MAFAQAPRARDTILYGGLTAGFFDAWDATLFFGSRGAAPDRIAQHVASGLLGRASFSYGAVSIVAGIILHFCVALSIATTFYLFARKLPVMIKHPVISGLAFGVIAYEVMDHVVVPLSRVPTPATAPPFSWAVWTNSVVGHAVLIGLPIALWAARSARKRPGQA